MNWLTWGLALGFALCVAGVAVNYSRKHRIEIYELVLLVTTTVYVSGCCFGFFVTQFSSPTPQTWWQALLVRTAWTLGGAALMVVGVFWSAVEGDTVRKPSVWLLAAGLFAIGVLISLHPLRDLIDGPQTLRFATINTEKQRGGARGGASISSRLQLVGDDGKPADMKLVGWAASEADEQLAACKGGATVVMLMHVERVLAVTCD